RRRARVVSGLPPVGRIRIPACVWKVRVYPPGICSMIRGSSKAERKRVCWRPNRNAETFLIIFVRFLWTNRSGCFKLNWMSGKQTGINAVDQILQKVDLAGIQDERARECIRLLLNLIESLTADLRKAHAEILYLREQLNRRKGGGGKPDRSKDSSAAASHSPEKERAERSETKPQTKRSKLDRGSDRPGRGAESRPDIASAGCGIQGLRRCGGAGVTLRHRQCEVSQGEVLRGLYRPNLPGAAAGWVPRRIRSQSEEPMPFVCSFVQHDGAQDRGSVGQHGHPDLQRPNLGVAPGRLSGTAGGKAGYCGSRIEQQRVAPHR